MNNSNLYIGHTKLHVNELNVSLESIKVKDETYYKIENYDSMPPFFMTIVSDVDFWMFVSSTGGITAGRKSPETALFPYYTDDKIHESNKTTGSDTSLIIYKGDKKYLWKPFDKNHNLLYETTSNLYKNTLGNKLMFESVNHDLELTFRYTYKTSDRFGLVKTSELINDSDQVCRMRILDGIRNILPYGVNTLLQTTKSNLVDGYKRCELVDENIGLYTLSSIITDRAEPSEALKATSVWSYGLDHGKILLSEEQVDDFSRDKDLVREEDIKGRRGAYYIEASMDLPGHDRKEWSIIAEVNQSASDIQVLKKVFKEDVKKHVEEDIQRGDDNLMNLVYQADGFQMSAFEKVGHRHFSNVLYNIMRGGTYSDAYMISSRDYKDFICLWNKVVYDKHVDFFENLPEVINYNDLIQDVSNMKDQDLERLSLEYLPLTYSRRHGDPSRPWNKFSIEVSKADGQQHLNFEGNWRDIFQNWEALSLSYPMYIEGIISKFVNASTPDGYNPYRITKSGIDWEVLDPENPWSNIGYWGDHQIIYLLKLMELSYKYNPKKLVNLLEREIFTYANVPYRIKGLEAIIDDPRNTILFDDQKQTEIDGRVKAVGADGKLLYAHGDLYHVNLIEKLLVTMLSKLSNYIPEGGIWMNTQRPEWNDANNALVGNGISMVTLYYLYRYQKFMLDLIDGLDHKVTISKEVKKMFDEMFIIFETYSDCLGSPMEDETRYTIVTSLGRIGASYRQSIYSDGFRANKETITYGNIKDFLKVTMAHLEDTITKNKRQDGLFHAYNLIKFQNASCHVSHLYEMLEGQVAVMSSGYLNMDETLELLESLRTSNLYRQDQNSYLLYPNKALSKFMDKNIVPDEWVASSSLLTSEIERGDRRFIERDIMGQYHFNASFRNGDELVAAIKNTGAYKPEDAEKVGDLFSALFNHYAFTGRSGTFYKYEGLGCIYWHMVSKLVLAVEEVFEKFSGHDDKEKLAVLSTYYHELKAGIGLDKSPENYGAFPTDAYSHTPGFAGVQQPGMTGQVKEDIISRFGELGVKVSGGQIRFVPQLLKKSEFLSDQTAWELPDRTLKLQKNQLAFTLCQVPIVYNLSDRESISVIYSNGDTYKFENTLQIDEFISSSLFKREGKIDMIMVDLEQDKLKD